MKQRCMAGILAALIPWMGCGEWHSNQTNDAYVEETRVEIAVPAATVEMQPGEQQSVTLVLSRPVAYQQSVDLHFDSSGGIEILPGTLTVRPTDPSFVTVQLRAAASTPTGNYAVRVQDCSKSGSENSAHFQVRVIRPEPVEFCDPVDRRELTHWL